MRKNIDKSIAYNSDSMIKIFDDLKIYFFIMDLDGKILHANNFTIKSLGYSKKKLIGKKLIDFHSKENTEAKSAFSKIFKNIIDRYIMSIVKHNDLIINVSLKFKKGIWNNVNALFAYSESNYDNINENNSVYIELKKSEELLNKLIINVPDVIIMTDMSGFINFISPNITKIVNVDYPEKYLNRNIFEFIHEEDKNLSKENFSKRINMQIGIIEYRICFNENDKIINCEINGDVLKDSEGKSFGYIFVLRDVSERKKIQDVKDEESNNYKFLSMCSFTLMKINNTRNIYNYIGIVLKEIIGDCIILLFEINEDKILKLTNAVGIDSDLMKNIINVIGYNPIDREFKNIKFIDTFIQEYENINENSECFLSKYVFKEFEKLININKVYSIGLKGHKRIIGGIQIVTLNDNNIKKPNLIEAFLHQASIAYENCSFIEKLSLSEERFRELAENIDQVFWLQTDEKIIYVSNAFEKLYERSCQSLYNNPKLFVDVIHYEDKERITNILKSDNFINAKNFDEEYRIVTPDGSLKWIRSRIFPIIGDKDKSKKAGIAEDITDKKHYENIIINSKMVAEEANYAKSRFLANMSHEIRTPLSVIIGFLKLLEKTNLSNEQKDYLLNSIDASSMLLYLINDILDFSKIEADKLKIENYKFNIYELIDETIKLFIPKADEKGLVLNYFVNPEIPEYIIGDASRIKQILNNLILNAIKFTIKGNISINIDKIYSDSNEVDIKFEVIDTGIGIKENDFNKLFNPFTQIDSSTTRSFNGTGLGLTITKRLIDMMNGEINIKSEYGKGSNFSCIIQFGIYNESLEDYIEYFNKLNNLNILLIADDISDENLITNCLKDIKCNIISLKVINDTDFNTAINIAIIDYGMLDAFKKNNLNNNFIKIIIVSDDNNDKIKEDEYTGVLVKPIKKSELFNIMRKKIIQNKKDQVGKNNISNNLITQKPEILLVEDVELNIKIIKKFLEYNGYSCDAAYNGNEALKAYNEKNYDIILMDCQMPVMDGYDATKAIRELEKKDKKHVFIVAMTAYAMDGDKDKCISSGMDEYLSKPINFDHLLKLIQNYTNKIHEKNIDENMEIIINNFVLKSGFDIEFVKKLMTEYLIMFDETIPIIKNDIESGNFENAAKLAHKMKGASGNLNLNYLFEKFLELEKNIKSVNLTNSSNNIKDIVDFKNKL